MGILKKVLDESIKNIDDDSKELQIDTKFKEMKQKFDRNIGKSYLWFNHTTKKLLLVEIVKPYDRYVTVGQSVFNLDKEVVTISHSISYSYLYSKLDKLIPLEGEV